MANRRLTNFSKLIITILVVIGMYVVISILDDRGIMTDKKGAKEALEDAGYMNIVVGGYGWFNCSEDDYYRTKFSAHSPNSGRTVTGCVCQGMFKDKTIRLD